MSHSKLHELLAVSGNLETQANNAKADLTNTFEKKQHLFREVLTTSRALTENAVDVAEEQTTIQTTVVKEIDWVSKILAKAFDVDYQIDVANTMAFADVILEDGTILLTHVPATALLQLEKKLRMVQDLAKSLPTLDPAKGFSPDSNREAGIYKATPTSVNRTKKVSKVFVLAPATDKHPAQVKENIEDEVVAKVTKMEWSSLITPATKSKVLEKTDELLRAVKTARSRANETQIDPLSTKVGSKLLEYVFQDLS